MTPPPSSPVALHHLDEGCSALVADIVIPPEPTDRQVVLRLLELGFVPGERVRMLRAGRDEASPMAVRVGHTTFALRPHEARAILVTPERP
jgi:Fe2+ transport system protein FeoA